jgi:hypothetical protein
VGFDKLIDHGQVVGGESDTDSSGFEASAAASDGATG